MTGNNVSCLFDPYILLTDVLSQYYLPVGAEEIHENPQSG
jgi:hypothetical protein